MAGSRWRVGALCAVLSAAVVCFCLQPSGVVTAEDKSETSAVNDEAAGAEQDSSPEKTPSSKKKSTNKKSDANARKKASKKVPARKSASKSSQQPSAGGSVGGGLLGGKGGNFGTDSGAGANQGDGLPGEGTGNGGRGNGAQRAGMQNDGPDPKDVQKVMDVQEKHTVGLMKQEGVVGTVTALSPDGKVFIKVYTNGAGNPKIPEKLDGVDVQAVLSGTIRPLNGSSGSAKYNPKARAARPVAIGVSAAPSVPGCAVSNNCYSGTLGCRLKAKDGSGAYALSNNHVFANEDTYVAGHQVMQPSPGELSVSCACLLDDEIGRLFRAKAIDTSGGINIMDAAIMKTTTEKVGNSTLPDGYGTPRTFTVQKATLGTKVQKYGRTTGYTKGTVTGVNAIAFVSYTAGIGFFVRQIEFTGENGSIFGDHGDSGSLIVTEDRFPIALLFAGSDITHVVKGNPIQPILDYFNMEIDGDDAQNFIPPGRIGSSGPNR